MSTKSAVPVRKESQKKCFQKAVPTRTAQPNGRSKETRRRHERHSEQILTYSRQYRAERKEQRVAYAKVQSEIRLGRLAKPDKCTLCKSSRSLRAHHSDYDRPLDVLWVCESCHECCTIRR